MSKPDHTTNPARQRQYSRTFERPVTGDSLTPRNSSPVTGVTRPLAVTDVSQVAVAVSPNRKFLFIQNNHATGSVTISFGGGGAVLGVGFVLAPNGGALLLDANVPTAAIHAIGTVANNSALTIVTA